MRPVRLELKGFTSFRDPQAIEFDGLDLFAISGQTGSGKSSLLDAMTYALYGTVERVGNRVGQLVSQGQKRMSVTFDFEVDGQVWRITRTTSSGGGSKVLMERAESDGWVQAGEGADRVREVDARVKELIGLDYEGFTRSVVLPQGKFQEFLVGNAQERRRILTDLLGLELFERLARRAGELERDARTQAVAKKELLETEYADATTEAVEAAGSQVAETIEREVRLAEAQDRVASLAEQAKRGRERAEVLAALAEEIQGVAERCEAASSSLHDLDEAIAAAAAARDQAEADTASADLAAEEARDARAKAEGAWGDPASLGAAREQARRLEQLRSTGLEHEARLAEVVEREPGLVEIHDRAVAAAADAATATADATERETRAREHLERVRLRDRAASVRAELRVGDPCPVCGSPVEQLPEMEDAPDLTHAQADLDAATAAISTCREAEAASQAVVDRVRRDREAAAGDRERLAAEIAKDREERDRIEQQLSARLGGDLPEDPIAALDERIRQLDALGNLEREASGAVAAAERTRTAAVGELDALVGRVAAERAGLSALPLASLVERAREAMVEEAGAIVLAPIDELPASNELGELTAAATALAAQARASADAVHAAARSVGGEDEVLLAEAGEALQGFPELIQSSPSIEALASALGDAHRQAATDVAMGREAVVRLEDRLGRRGDLEVQAAGAEERQARFHDLATELRADRLIAFLQSEALRLLAAAGSDRLAQLSGDRYRLRFADESFSVVDVWNGEEERPARTLSGGETFLASLALALALADQVQALAVNQRARLESLFLDEGFGTLDPESLEIVVEAIEQLGGDGRMVGVISHVHELAIRLPARIEVEKSPRGSRLRRVS